MRSICILLGLIIPAFHFLLDNSSFISETDPNPVNWTKYHIYCREVMKKTPCQNNTINGKILCNQIFGPSSECVKDLGLCDCKEEATIDVLIDFKFKKGRCCVTNGEVPCNTPANCRPRDSWFSCIEGKCKCGPGEVWVVYSLGYDLHKNRTQYLYRCVPDESYSYKEYPPCDPKKPDPCGTASRMICSKQQRCVCPLGYVKDSLDGKCKRYPREKCDKYRHHECYTDMCDENTLTCACGSLTEIYDWNLGGCVPRDTALLVGTTCKHHHDCRHDHRNNKDPSKLNCHKEKKKCECLEPYVYVNGRCANESSSFGDPCNFEEDREFITCNISWANLMCENQRCVCSPKDVHKDKDFHSTHLKWDSTVERCVMITGTAPLIEAEAKSKAVRIIINADADLLLLILPLLFKP